MGNDVSYGGLCEYECFEANFSFELFDENVSIPSSEMSNLGESPLYSRGEQNIYCTPIPSSITTTQQDYVTNSNSSESAAVVQAEAIPLLRSWVNDHFPCFSTFFNTTSRNRCIEFAWCFQLENENKTTLYPSSYLKPRVVGIFYDEHDQAVSNLYSKVDHQAFTQKRDSHSVSDRSKGLQEVQCSICLDIFDRPVVTSCHHIFCHDCITNSLVCKCICPLCRAPVKTKSLKTLTTVKRDKVVEHIKKKFLSLGIECPQCDWKGIMLEWGDHIHSNYCRVMSKNIHERMKNTYSSHSVMESFI